MKKYFFILIIFLIAIVSVSAKNVDKRLDTNNLNSNNLLKYLESNNLSGKTIKVCKIDTTILYNVHSTINLFSDCFFFDNFNG